jgi:hypothetical protein
MHGANIISLRRPTCPAREFGGAVPIARRSAMARGANGSPRLRERGIVLVTTLVIACLVGIVVGALMIVSTQQNSIIARSQTWCSEIPIAEAGIEEAMSHLNNRPTDLASDGWTLTDDGKFAKIRTVGDGYFSASISPTTPPTIISIGYGRIPTQTNFTQRTVVVTTKRASAGGFGVVAKNFIKMSGTNTYIDSFDSSDKDHSSNGLYTFSKRLDDVMVGSLSSNQPAIDTGSGFIYGQVSTGPMGTASGTIGDGDWIANPANAGQSQAGHVSDDFNMSIPAVTVPYSGGALVPSWPISPLPKVITLTSNDYLQSGDFNIPLGSALLIGGKVRLNVTGKFTTSGSGYVSILPGGSLELYVGGICSISGAGVVNATESAANCAIYGLPTCTTVSYSGTAAYIGQIYAPQASFSFSGSAGASGAFTAKSITLSGSAGLHYDKALGRPTAPYEISSWAEL